MHILVELDESGEDKELVDTANAAVTVRFPHNVAPAGWEGLSVGRMITNLDEQFRSTLPEPVAIESLEDIVISVDDDWAEFEVDHFTVYGLLGPHVPGDVTGNGQVDAVDIQLVINYVLGLSIDERYRPDVNGDGKVNALDIQFVINRVLGIPMKQD